MNKNSDALTRAMFAEALGVENLDLRHGRLRGFCCGANYQLISAGAAAVGRMRLFE
jgi:hypothetical protein